MTVRDIDVRANSDHRKLQTGRVMASLSRTGILDSDPDLEVAQLNQIEKKFYTTWRVRGNPGGSYAKFRRDCRQLERKMIQSPIVGGLILFSTNFIDQQQIAKLIQDIQTLRTQAELGPLIIAIDHEGGTIQRFRGDGFTELPSHQSIGKTYDTDPQQGKNDAYTVGRVMVQDLVSVGVTNSFAPVVDLDLGNPVITDLNRSFHQDPDEVIVLAEQYILGMQSMNMASIPKHIPGHGYKDVGDTHLRLGVHNRTREEIFHDMRPFHELIKRERVDALMLSHIKYPTIDPDHNVATSKIWYEIIRQDMSFDGFLMTDALDMKGAGTASTYDKVHQVLVPGADMAMLCNIGPWEIVDLPHDDPLLIATPTHARRIYNFLAPQYN